ncbi:MAG: hypothetical protein J7M34_13815 [Anaerolineae bacterium]|nr:hypothetical protein [Anaerolineae bacterium]
MQGDVRQRLQAIVERIPAVDVHSHINYRRPAASDVDDIVFYHYIVSELITAGMPAAQLSQGSTPCERLQAAVPYMPRIANTSTYWTLQNMIHDLYGIDGPLDEAAWMSLCERVEAGSHQPDRAAYILKERSHIQRTFLTMRWDETWEGLNTDLFSPTVRVEALASHPWTEELLCTLEQRVRRVIRDASDVEQAMNQLVETWKAEGMVALAVAFQRERAWDWAALSRSRADAALRALRRGESLSSREADDLNVFAWRSLLGACSEQHIPVQVMLGIRRLSGGTHMPVTRPNILASLSTLFADFPKLRFDIILANPVQSHELAAYAKMHPNVSVAGYWWYALSPSVIRRMLRERIEMLPGVKIQGFFSDAYCVEWSYAKLLLVRRQITHVLADMVEEGYLEEEQAASLAEDLLDRNPRRLYLEALTGRGLA